MSDHSSSRHHDDELVEELANNLIRYYIHQVYCDVSIKGLHETIEDFPVEHIEEAIVKSKIFPIFLSSEHVTLDVVTHLVEKYPSIVSTVETEDDERIIREMWNPDNWLSGSSKIGSMPLHIACRNEHCPTSVIKFLLETYPSAAGKSWSWTEGSSSGFPLHCYLMRAIEQCEAYDYEWGEVTSEIPGQQLDYDTVEMLVHACPDALTTKANLGTPLNILCQGCSVTLELARLLTGDELKCFEVDDSNIRFPMRCLLENDDFDSDSFPTDVFRYLMECSPSSLRRQQPWPVEYDNELAPSFLGTDTLLHVACSNPEIAVEVIQIIVDECPYMLKEEYADDGFLPIHNLCCNEDLDDESSMDILQILVNAFPASVRTNVGVAHGFPDWLHKKRGENDLPIHYACRYKSLDFCRYIIEMHPDSVSIRQLHYEHEDDFSGSLMLPFHLACKYGQLDLLQYVLEQYPEALKERTSDGRFKHVEFNESNASLLQVGNYPLHLAVSREDSPEKMEIINFLLQQDVNASSKVGKYGNLALHTSCWHYSRSELKIVEKLFQSYPAAIDTKNIFGQLPIHLAMQTSDKNTFDGLSFLAFQRPASVSILDERGMSCAHYACTSRNALEKLKLIAELCPKAFRCQSDSCGLPIHYASSKGCNEEVLRYLVSQYPESLGVHVGSLGSPLHCVPEEGYHGPLLFLLKEKYRNDMENGLPIAHAFLTDDEIQDKDRILALQPFGPDERAEEDKKGRTLSHLIFRITKDVELIKRNLNRPDMLSKQDQDGWLPLHHAMRHNASLETVCFLLDGHLDLLQVTDNVGRTPFHIACCFSGKAVMKVLLMIDPELVRVADNMGRTALHHACKSGRSTKTIAFLLKKNSDITAVDRDGDRPLHMACRRGYAPMIKYLMSKDMAAVYARNNLNELPVQVLSNRNGKKNKMLESTEYTGAIFELLLAYPETVDV